MGFIMRKIKEKAIDAIETRMLDAVIDKVTKVYPEERLLEQKQNSANLLVIHQPSKRENFYTIKNTNGDKKYTVKIEHSSRKTNLHISDKIKTEHWIAKKKPFSIKPTFIIVANKNVMGRLIKTKKLPKPRYEVDYLGWRGEGDFHGSNLNFYDTHGLVVSISWSHNKSLVVSFPNSVSVENELSGIALAIILDTTGR